MTRPITRPITRPASAGLTLLDTLAAATLLAVVAAGTLALVTELRPSEPTRSVDSLDDLGVVADRLIEQPGVFPGGRFPSPGVAGEIAVEGYAMVEVRCVAEAGASHGWLVLRDGSHAVHRWIALDVQALRNTNP